MSTVALGYARLSPGDRKTKDNTRFTGVSIETQLESINKYCAFREYKLVCLAPTVPNVPIYIDDGISGKNMEGRPAFLSMREALNTLSELRDAMRSKFKNVKAEAKRRVVSMGLPEDMDEVVVVVAKLDRLFRNASDCLAVASEWDKKDIGLHFIDMGGGQSVDTKTAMGKFFLTIMAGAAEMERNMTSERTTSIMDHLKHNNQVYCHYTPLGWKRDGKALVPNEAERAWMRKMVALKTEGWTFSQIAYQFQADGVPTRNGTAWTCERLFALNRKMERNPELYDWINAGGNQQCQS